jgi:hypothetical protein
MNVWRTSASLADDPDPADAFSLTALTPTGSAPHSTCGRSPINGTGWAASARSPRRIGGTRLRLSGLPALPGSLVHRDRRSSSFCLRVLAGQLGNPLPKGRSAS